MQQVKRLAIITTHPVQYYAPLFKLLQERQELTIKVYYSWGEASLKKHDPGFDKYVEWDLPLLEGYPYEWANNIAKDQGSHHFNGIITPYLPQQVATFTPDAILVFGWAYRSHLALIRHFSGKVPVYFRGDSTLLDKTGFLKKLLRNICLGWIYKHIDHAFYTGVSNKDYFKNYGLTENQLSFAPHAVDNDRFFEDRCQEARQLRGKLQLTDENILILFAGKLEAKKDPKILLQAFFRLKKPGVHLLFVGNGSLEKELKSIVNDEIGNSCQTASHIHFMDFLNQTQMPALYQACDLFCLPSEGPAETWGLSVNEAMACAKAILVSDKVGCSLDLIKPGLNGEVFHAGNLSDLLKKLSAILDKEKLVKFGQLSKDLIEGWNYSNQVKPIIKKLYE